MVDTVFNCYADDSEQLMACAKQLFTVISAPAMIYLQGQLGAGKTTFVRGLLRAADYHGAVKSPTYTLVESYELKSGTINHFDLYRLGSGEELEWMGMREYCHAQAICCIEWPEKAQGYLPDPDLAITIELAGAGRELSINAKTQIGKQWVAALNQAN